VGLRYRRGVGDPGPIEGNLRSLPGLVSAPRTPRAAPRIIAGVKATA